MKTDTILNEFYEVKERLAEVGGEDAGSFLDGMDAWLSLHPHPGPMAETPEAWKAMRLARPEDDAALPPQEPYRIHDPIIAEIHRYRALRYMERQEGKAVAEETMIVRDGDPPDDTEGGHGKA